MFRESRLFGVAVLATLSLSACGDSSVEGQQTTTFFVKNMGKDLKLL